MRNRKGTSLVETLVMLGPAVLILGAALLLMTRSAVHDSANDRMLSALDGALIANERVQTDLACAQGGRVGLEDGALKLEAVSRRAGTEPATWTVARGAMARNGVPVRAAQVKQAAFEIQGDVLTITLATADRTLAASAHLRESQARAEHGSWFDASRNE